MSYRPVYTQKAVRDVGGLDDGVKKRIGKTHLATAICHDAILKGYQAVFIPLFDLTAKLAKAKNLYSLIDIYAKVPILCLDELGYYLPSKEQADALFQIISKRTEVATTLVTTNLVPSDWGKIFDTVAATAIRDRLSMNGRFITFEGNHLCYFLLSTWRHSGFPAPQIAGRPRIAFKQNLERAALGEIKRFAVVLRCDLQSLSRWCAADIDGNFKRGIRLHRVVPPLLVTQFERDTPRADCPELPHFDARRAHQVRLRREV